MSTKKKPAATKPAVVENNLPAAVTAPAETKAVAMQTQSGSVLPSLAGASPEILERMREVAENLESIDSFRLPRAKMTAGGIELIEGEAPLTELEGVIVHTRKTNVYYDKPYNPADKAAPPRCYSLDGNVPVADLKDKEGKPLKPMHATCKGCPMAEFGTNLMKSGKACRNMKPIYLLLSDEAIIPRQLTVTPTALKAANQYLMDLTEQGIAYRKVKTKITLYKENPRDTYFKLKFSKGAKLDGQKLANVEFLRNQWLPRMNAQVVDINEGAEQVQPPRDIQKDVNGEF